jgi:putative peptidoglycan lipid II flippase
MRGAALAALVGAGALVYGLATLVSGAFSREDIQLLTRRRRAA